MLQKLLLALVLPVCAFGQVSVPTITSVTNGAMPTLNYPPSSVHLAPRSMATIFGVNLADAAISAQPWQQFLGGIEVHLVASSVARYDPQRGVTARFPATDDFTAPLIYVSPTQINFVVPDVDPTALWSTRIVIVKNGVRFDNLFNTISGTGLITIDAVLWGNYSVVYGVGYDCLYSFSLTDSGACGLSWSQGLHRAMLGAITDAASGQLITAQNPVHQGQLITLWLTGLTGLNRDDKTGLLQQKSPQRFAFGVAQYGKDLPGTVSPGEFGEYGQFMTLPSLWAGESPEYMGLDQANVNFPVCTVATKATSEKRYDAFLTYTNVNTYTGVETDTTVRVYLPFVVRVGDPDCHWTLPLFSTSTTLASSVNPSVTGQAVSVTGTVSPSAATGTVAFYDGATPLGTGTLNGGKTTLSTSSLSASTHSLTAIYSGDSTYSGSTSDALLQTVKINKTNSAITLTSSVNPSAPGQAVMFGAVVSPSAATGTVTFMDGSSKLGSVTLGAGKATLSTAALTAGTHSITALFSGDAIYNVSTSSVVTQTVNYTATITLSSTNLQGGIFLTATISPTPKTAPTYVKFFDNGVLVSSTGGQATNSGVRRTQLSLSGGTHVFTASFNGYLYQDSTTSTPLILTTPNITLTSSSNPCVKGQPIVYTATMSPVSAATALDIAIPSQHAANPGEDVQPGPLPMECSDRTPLTNGVSTCSTTCLSGSYAAFTSGTNNFTGGTSNTFIQSVTQ